MSDELNRSIQRWRDALAGREAFSPERLDELQDHLVAELDQIPVEGLSDEERLLVAGRRVGDPVTLEAQFLAVDPRPVWRRRLWWMAVGWFVLSALPAMVSGLIKSLLPLVAVGLSLPTPVVGTIGLLLHGLMWAALFYLLWRRFEGTATRFEFAFARWVGSHPGWTIMIAVALMLVFRGVATGVNVWAIVVYPPSIHGELAVWSIFGGVGLTALIATSLMALVWKSQRPSLAND